MPYQFRQTGAEIQDILDQVPTNTSDIATMNSGYASVTVSDTLATNGWTMVANTDTLEAGLYLVYCGCSFLSNATGRRMLHLNASSSSASPSRYALTQNAVDGYATNMSMTRFINLSSSSALYLWAYQNSGDDLSIQPFIQTIRLK